MHAHQVSGRVWPPLEVKMSTLSCFYLESNYAVMHIGTENAVTCPCTKNLEQKSTDYKTCKKRILNQISFSLSGIKQKNPLFFQISKISIIQ